MSTLLIDGLAVEIEGEGTPIVCVHGLGGSSNTWTPLLGALQGYQVVRIDLPGSARSGAGSGSLSIEDMVEAVIAVCHRVGIKNAHFLGHSMGTIVCQHLAVDRPDLVKTLALFGPLPCPPEGARHGIATRAQKAAEGGLAAMQDIADAIVKAATASATRQHLPVVLAMIRESLMRQDPLGYSRCCLALSQSQPAALERIEVPVLLITGDEDGVAPPSTVREMAARIGHATMEILPQCGHWTTFEKPDECCLHLRDFLHRH